MMIGSGSVIQRFSSLLKRGQIRVQKQFQLHPKFTNACSGFLTFSVGDILAQQLVSVGDWDIKRSFKAGLLGAFMNGTCLHYWYRSLDFAFTANMKSKTGIVLKIIADQIIYAPFAIGSYFAFSTYEKSSDWLAFKTNFQLKINESFATTYIADCCLWPFVNFLNFRIIPIVYRPSFISVVQLSWQTYLSKVSHRSISPTYSPMLREQILPNVSVPFSFPEQVGVPQITANCAEEQSVQLQPTIPQEI